MMCVFKIPVPLLFGGAFAVTIGVMLWLGVLTPEPVSPMTVLSDSLIAFLVAVVAGAYVDWRYT